MFVKTLFSFSMLVGVAASHEQQHRSLIIGGHNAPKGRYPYFATFDHFGGGVLIAPDIILTAGHCNPSLKQHVKVRINHDTFQSTNFAVEPDDDETFTLVQIEQHPDFYSISWDETVNDFNLFKISGFSQETPVKLNRKTNFPQAGTTVTVIGMGSTKPDPDTFVESAATTLQEVQLKTISQKQCEASKDPKNRPKVSYAGRVFEESMICTTGGPHNERDACAFDSGSPLLVKGNDGEDLVVGLVSWGEDCADPFFPAVNARVSSAMDWIDKTVCEISDADPSQLTEFNCGGTSSTGSLFSLEIFSIHKNDSYSMGTDSIFVVAGLLVLKACLVVGVFGAVLQIVMGRKKNQYEQIPLQSADADAVPVTYSTL